MQHSFTNKKYNDIQNNMYYSSIYFTSFQYYHSIILLKLVLYIEINLILSI